MQFWWLGVIAAVVLWDFVSGDSYRPSVVLYDNSSCFPPASVVSFPNAYCSSPQADHYAPVCQDNSESYSVTDCDWYHIGGHDYYGLIQQAFGDSVPYLIVEEYFQVSWWWSACTTEWRGRDYGLGGVTAYRLDEDCHSDRDGTGATKLTLDDKLTLTKYNDPSCNSVLSQKVVTWEMATQGQCVDNSKFYLRGAKPAMAAVAVFDDMACSTPTKITFTQHFGCSVVQDPFNSMCGPSGPTQYSISTCTSDISSFTETTFGRSTRYLAVEKHSDSGCGALQSVNVYVADGSCHANMNDGTSFIVNINADGSGTIALYLDSYCSQPGESEEVTKQMVTHYTCAQDLSGCVDGSCSKRYFIGGFGGPPAKGIMTAVSVYGDTSCSSPATTMKLTRELFCIPQLNPLEPECENVNGVYLSSDCEVYTADGWDSSGLNQQAFGGHTQLTVQEYDTSFGECAGTDALIQATVYLLGEECHPNRDSTASTKLTFGRSLTITTFDDPFCSVQSSEMEVTWESALYASCVGGSTRAFLSSWPDLTAVAVFEGEGCTERPVKLQFMQLFGCSVAEDPIKSVCGPDGSSHYSISSCTRDYNGLTTSTFSSNTPYLMVEEFADYSCSHLQNVMVYTADGSCHTNTDDTTSFMAIISKDGSVTITTYLDSSCTIVDDSTSLSKRKLIDSSTCYPSDGCTVDGGLCSTRISYGGMGDPPSKGQMTAVTFYGADSSCSQPAELIEYTRELVCAPQPNYWNPMCESDGELYYTSYCTSYWSVGWDNYGLLDRAFGSNAYLLVEEYDLSFGYCGDSYAVDSVAAYHLLDEECHESRDGATSYQLTLGHTVVITKYDDSVCTTTSSQTEVSWRTANRSPCTNASPTKATRFYFRGPQPPFTAVAVYEDSECSGKPVKVRFSQDFVCDATLHPKKAVCGAEGTAFYSIASCTSDYSSLTDTLLGTDLPYIMVEEFDDYYCGLVQEVTVYTADGSCHSSTNGTSSFMATLTPDGSATITTYSDTMCSVVDKTTTMTRRELLAYSCLQDSNECTNEDGWSCSKRISVGGLGGLRSQGQMISVASYNNTGCPPPASTVAFTRGLICTHQSNGASPVCEDNDTVSFSSDCLQYNLGGWDNANSYISQALGWSQPYLLVEEYDESVSIYATLANSTAYLLDSACHANHEGTASTRLTLGLSLTIAEYEDPYCEIVSMETEVTFAEAYHNAFIDNRIITYLRGGIADLSAVAVYADSACSELPVKLTLTQYFQCNGEQDLTKTVCEPSNAKLYSTSSCTRDYFALANTVFGGDNPYVLVEEYSDRWCGLVQSVTVYAADGACHFNDDGVTSFRVTLASDRSATITRYSDTRCKNVEDSESRRWEILSYSCIQTSDCVDAARYGCSKRFSVGGLGELPSLGQMTGITMYRNSSCSQPAETVSITRDLVCKPNAASDAAVCKATDSVDLYSVSQCVSVANPWNTLDKAFGWRSHLVVEEYDTSIGSCWARKGLADVTAYLLDEACHVNSFGTASSKLTFGESLILTTYNDASCSSVSSEKEVTWNMVAYGCADDKTMYYLRGASPDLTAVAVYRDKSCGGTPTKLELTRRFGCNADQDPSQSTCTSDGSMVYSVSSCIGDYMYPDFALTKFGNDTPYLIEERFMDMWCGQIQSVMVYIADGSCQSNTDGVTSFMATISVDNQATLVTYSDASCGAVNTLTSVINVGNDTFGASCVWGSACSNSDASSCSKRFSVGGLGGSRSMASKAVMVYDDNYCDEPPVQLVVTNQWACSSPATPTCSATSTGANTVYEDYTCIDDVAAFAASQFGNAPYLIVENFMSGTKCGTQQGAVVYRAEEGCYYNVVDGTSFRIFPNAGGSVTIATYPASSCNDYEADYVTVGAKYLNTGECFNERLRLHANMTGMLSPVKQMPSTDIDYKAREEIMFPEWLWEPAPRRVFESS